MSKNYSIHGNNLDISCPHNFWAPVKSNITDAWSWHCWILFGSQIKVGAMYPLPHLPHSPSVCTPDNANKLWRKPLRLLLTSHRLNSHCYSSDEKQENQNQPLGDVIQNSSTVTVLKQLKKSVKEFIQSTNDFQLHLSTVSKQFCHVFFLANGK